MKQINKYKTRHRTELTDFFKKHCDKEFSSRDIIENSDLKLGEATVYRLLKALTDDGIIKRQVDSDSRPCAVYSYDSAHCGCMFHLKCNVCGKVTHMDCEVMKLAEKHIQDEHGFTPDGGMAIVYGICKNCNKD